MRCALVFVPEVDPPSGPDLTSYFVVCAGAILGLLVLAHVFRRTVARHLRRRAARRSLQVLDVLPLSGKQKLCVVRCYDRSFLLALGEKEVRSIAELDLDERERADGERSEAPSRADFRAVLRDELVPARASGSRPSAGLIAPDARAPEASAPSERPSLPGGLLA